MARMPAFSRTLWARLLNNGLLVVLLLALVTRFGASTFERRLDAELENDEFVFTRIAWNLVLGNGYSQNGQVPTAERPPAYPLLLSGIFCLVSMDGEAQPDDPGGEEIYRTWPTITHTQARNYRVAARVINIILGTLTVGMIYILSYRLFSQDVALCAGLIGAFYPSFIRESLKICSDTLFTFIVTLVVFVFVKIQTQPDSVRLKLLGGFLVGVGILTRSELVLFAPFLFVWALLVHRQFRRAVGTFVILLLPILLLILPWLARNYVAFDELLMATNSGLVMWGVHNPEVFADPNLMGRWLPPDIGLRSAGQRWADPSNPAYRYLPELEWNRQLFKLGLESIQQNWRSMPRMEVYKLTKLIFTDGAIRNLLRFPVLYSFIFGLILLLASKTRRPLSILYMLLIFSVLSTLAFYTNERLRMYVDPTFILIASYGLSELFRLIKHVKEHKLYSVSSEGTIA